MVMGDSLEDEAAILADFKSGLSIEDEIDMLKAYQGHLVQLLKGVNAPDVRMNQKSLIDTTGRISKLEAKLHNVNSKKGKLGNVNFQDGRKEAGNLKRQGCLGNTQDAKERFRLDLNKEPTESDKT